MLRLLLRLLDMYYPQNDKIGGYMQVLILGVSTKSMLLAKRLCEKNDVILVDENASEFARINKLDVVTINGMMIDTVKLEEAGIETADVVCALSDSENLNLVSAQIARNKYNVNCVIACVYDTEEYNIFEGMDIIPISATDLTVDSFVRTIYNHNSSDRGADGVFITSVFDKETKIKLFKINGELEGAKLKDISDADGGVIAGVVRNNDLIQYNPDFKVEYGDKIYVLDILE